MSNSDPSSPDGSPSYRRGRHYYSNSQSSTSSVGTTFSSDPNARAAYPSTGASAGTGTYTSMPYAHPGGGTTTQGQAYQADSQGAFIDPSVPAHFRGYSHIQHGHPVVPSQQYGAPGMPASPPQPRYIPTQAQAYAYSSGGGGGGTYPHAHIGSSNMATVGLPASPTSPISPSSSPPSGASPYRCDLCGVTFTRPHDRKRHHESHHTNTQHTCQWCGKGYARYDSLKRHWDKPCPKMPPSAASSSRG